MSPGASNKGARRLDLKELLLRITQREHKEGKGSPGQDQGCRRPKQRLQEGGRASAHLKPSREGAGEQMPQLQLHLPPIPCSCPLWSGLICKNQGSRETPLLQSQNCQPAGDTEQDGERQQAGLGLTKWKISHTPSPFQPHTAAKAPFL